MHNLTQLSVAYKRSWVPVPWKNTLLQLAQTCAILSELLVRVERASCWTRRSSRVSESILTNICFRSIGHLPSNINNLEFGEVRESIWWRTRPAARTMKLEAFQGLRHLSVKRRGTIEQWQVSQCFRLAPPTEFLPRYFEDL